MEKVKFFLFVQLIEIKKIHLRIFDQKITANIKVFYPVYH